MDLYVALISVAGSIIGTFAGVATSAKLTNYRLEQLEKKVESQYKLVDEIARIHAKIAVIEEKLKEDIK